MFVRKQNGLSIYEPVHITHKFKNMFQSDCLSLGQNVHGTDAISQHVFENILISTPEDKYVLTSKRVKEIFAFAWGR